MNGLPETGCAADMVWYGAYGSNLQFQRFKYYIIGGKPPGAYKKHHPMQDKTLPTLDLRFIMRRRVYFAERSLVWNGGVAFISAEESPEEKALCRIYLIKRLQFVELFAQENHIQMSEVNIDFDKLSLEKRVISGKGRYRLILHVGEKRGHPIYTFTRPRESQSEFIPPSEKYLETMINGLIECWSTKKKSELIEYLYSVTRGTYNRNKLAYLFDMRQKK